MNAETGQIYEGREAIEAALTRGEPLVEVTPRFARRAKKDRRGAQKLGQALANLARTRPDLTPAQREEIAQGMR